MKLQAKAHLQDEINGAYLQVNIFRIEVCKQISWAGKRMEDTPASKWIAICLWSTIVPEIYWFLDRTGFRGAARGAVAPGTKVGGGVALYKNL